MDLSVEKPGVTLVVPDVAALIGPTKYRYMQAGKGKATPGILISAYLPPAAAGCSAPLARHRYLFASCETPAGNVRDWYGVAARYHVRCKGSAGTGIPSRRLSPARLPSLQYVHQHNVDKSSATPYLRLASMAVSFSAQALVSGKSHTGWL